MADVNGVNRTKWDNPTPANVGKQGEAFAQAVVVYDKYTAAALAAAKTIAVGPKLPKGARIRDIQVKAAALGTSTSLKVGDSHDDDRYITNYATNGATAKSLFVDGVIGMNDYVVGTNDGDDQILIKTGAAGTYTGAIHVVISFVHAS
jgi:hypothetical protein